MPGYKLSYTLTRNREYVFSILCIHHNVICSQGHYASIPLHSSLSQYSFRANRANNTRGIWFRARNEHTTQSQSAWQTGATLGMLHFR